MLQPLASTLSVIGVLGQRSLLSGTPSLSESVSSASATGAAYAAFCAFTGEDFAPSPKKRIKPK